MDATALQDELGQELKAGQTSIQLAVREEAQKTRDHKYVETLEEALDPLPNKGFDAALVRVAYVEDFGTAYIDAYEREAFNLNKTDDHGNTLLLISAQNGSDKIAKLLSDKTGFVQRYALTTMKTLGPKIFEPHADMIANMSTDDDADVRMYAVRAIGTLGPEVAGLHADKIATLLSDEIWIVQHSAVQAMATLGPEFAGPHAYKIATLLSDEHADVRYFAVEAMAKLVSFMKDFATENA